MPDTESKTRTSSAKITEALELLNEVAQEKKDELKGLMTDKYSHIKEAMTATTEQGKQLLNKAVVDGGEKIKEIAKEADSRVRKDPWPYIAGAAAFSLLLGYLLGSKNK